MKIHPDQLRALEQEQAKSRSAQEADKGFGELLAKEVEGTAPTTAQGAAAPPLGGAALSGNILAAQSAAGEPSESGQEVMERLENLLGEWEAYANNLGSTAEGGGLRQANGNLETIENEVASLKQTMSGRGQEGDDELKAVIDEVEILAVTERIKFNRGDYV